MKRTIAFIICLMIIFSAFSCSKPGKDNGTASTAESVPQPVPGRFGTIGFYAFDDVTDAKCKFWVACGIDTIELLDIGWFFRAGKPLENRNRTMQEWIKKAHKYGLKVVVILLTNLEQWTGEADYGNGSGKPFDPENEEKMNERLGYIEKQIDAFSEADGFSLFAGDPGGVGAISGYRSEGDIRFFLDMTVKVREIVREKAPDAFFNVNIWAVSQWEISTWNPSAYAFWKAEDDNGREIIQMGDLINSDIGIEIPGHDYYRPLALRIYNQSGEYPADPFPSKEYTDIAKENGVERIWGFSHFLLDELDDGDAERGSDTLGITTRYIKKYIDAMDSAGMNGVIAGNCRLGNYLNLYAFSRFAQDASLTPEDVLREYASYLVPAEQVDTLTKILKFLENDANWHRKMPEKFREPDFEVKYSSAKEAYIDAEKLTPLTYSSFDLPETAADYIAKVLKRLWAIVTPEERAELSGGMYVLKADEYMAKTGGLVITASDKSGVNVYSSDGNKQRCVWMVPEKTVEIYRLLSYCLSDGEISRICVTRKWNDGKGDIDLPVETGAHSEDIFELLKDAESDGMGYVYITVYTTSTKPVSITNFGLMNGQNAG